MFSSSCSPIPSALLNQLQRGEIECVKAGRALQRAGLLIEAFLFNEEIQNRKKKREKMSSEENNHNESTRKPQQLGDKYILLTLLSVSGLIARSLEASLSPFQPFLTALLITLSPVLQKHSGDLGSRAGFCTSLRK